jgi:alpha-glucosidase (family GH31 glycosyl hydrolase)
MTPLPLAWPDDPQVYGRENDRVRGYEWMIGDALLAAPLYGEDYETGTTRDVYLPAGTWIDYDTGERYQGPKLLKDFALPPGKTPLFAGGSGIVVEKSGSGLVARVYPVAANAETLFFDRDGQTTSTIRVKVADWSKVTVTAASGRPCAGAWRRHAFEFPLVPGERYELR